MLALAPALILYTIAAILFYRIDVGGLTVMEIVFTAIGAAIARLTLLLWARVAAGSATLLLTDALRARLAAKIGTLPLGELVEERAAPFAAKLLDDVENVGAFLSGAFVDIVAAAAMVLAATAVVLARDWRLAAALALFIVAGCVWAGMPGVSPAAAEREQQAREALASAAMGALRTGACAQTLPPQPGPVAELAARYRGAATARLARTASLEAVQRAYAGAMPAFVVLAGVALGGTRLDLPNIVLLAALGLRASGALGTVFGTASASETARLSLRRIAALLARPPAPDGRAPVPATMALRFAGVHFSYPGGRGPVLRDVDFVAAPGTVTAIVGPSGSGKTTLLRLAARFWDPERGRVELDGVDVRELPAEEFVKKIACVFQDVALLDDTVAANLRLGHPGASDAELVEAARTARAHEFISALPAGYDTILGERGQRLSRGERQRLQIARALLKDAPLILLDEPTASMDALTEAEIEDALAPLVRGKTVLVVTHRLGTVVDADRIVVLDRDGFIEASGSHAELLERGGTYGRLWADYRASIVWEGAERALTG